MANLEKQWFVMRDLKRRNSNVLAIHELTKAGLEVFSPMTQMIMTIGGRRQRREVPVIQDLLFVHEAKNNLDPFVEKNPTLQYRYLRGRTKDEPMTVRKDEMDKFIFAVNNVKAINYYKPGELTAAMYGKKSPHCGWYSGPIRRSIIVDKRHEKATFDSRAFRVCNGRS